MQALPARHQQREARTGSQQLYQLQGRRDDRLEVVLPLNMVDKSISPFQTNFGLDLVFEQSNEATSSRGEVPSECFC